MAVGSQHTGLLGCIMVDFCGLLGCPRYKVMRGIWLAFWLFPISGRPLYMSMSFSALGTLHKAHKPAPKKKKAVTEEAPERG